METVPENIILVNAFAPSMFNHPRRLSVEFRRVSFEELKKIRGEFKSYIRHPATTQVLSQQLQREIPTNSGTYSYTPGDKIFMVVLASPMRGQEVTPRVEDLVIYEVIVREIE